MINNIMPEPDDDDINDYQEFLRTEALRFATLPSFLSPTSSTKEILVRAKAFYEFLKTP